MENLPNKNYFTLVRLVLAFSVLVGHSTVVSGNWFFIGTGNLYIGTLAVFGFFTISGYLVTPGVQSSSFRAFAARRVARIYPAYWALSFVTIFVFASIWQIQEARWQLTLPEYLLYLLRNIMIPPAAVDPQQSLWNIGHGLPNLVPENGEVNPPLWSLFLEILCYLALSAVAVLTKRWFPNRFREVILFGLFALWAISIIGATLMPEFWLENQTPLQTVAGKLPYLLAFGTGVLVRVFENSRIMDLLLKPFIVTTFLAVSYVCSASPLLWAVAGSFCFSVAIVFVGRVAAPLAIAKMRDISYGVYLYHFPIMQILTYFDSLRNPYLLILASTPLTVLFAYLSSRFVEVPLAPAVKKLIGGTKGT